MCGVVFRSLKYQSVRSVCAFWKPVKSSTTKVSKSNSNFKYVFGVHNFPSDTVSLHVSEPEFVHLGFCYTLRCSCYFVQPVYVPYTKRSIELEWRDSCWTHCWHDKSAICKRSIRWTRWLPVSHTLKRPCSTWGLINTCEHCLFISPSCATLFSSCRCLPPPCRSPAYTKQMNHHCGSLPLLLTAVFLTCTLTHSGQSNDTTYEKERKKSKRKVLQR